MTHLPQSTRFGEAIQLLTEYGFEGLAEVLELLLNEVMKSERCEVLGAAPYERTADRQGYANGFKDKSVRTRVGDLHLKVPQARDVEFYPQALERGVRSERALTTALAEMYVQGVSTRKVAKIVEELCGREISSSTVSRLAGQLDEELTRWRERPLPGRCSPQPRSDCRTNCSAHLARHLYTQFQLQRGVLMRVFLLSGFLVAATGVSRIDDRTLSADWPEWCKPTFKKL